jgi:hypothetical protein
MTAGEIRQIVLQEIGSDWTRRNLHALTPRNDLLDVPIRIKMIDAVGEQEVIGWVVLAESHDLSTGYAVVFSEPDQQFGLVQFVSGYQPCLFGIYGDFWSAFDGM